MSASASPSSRSSQLAGSLFATLDTDSDGWICVEDLSGFIEDPTKLAEIVSALAPDAAGRISRERFVESFESFMEEDDEQPDEDEGKTPTHAQRKDSSPEEDTVADLDVKSPVPVAVPKSSRRHTRSVSFAFEPAVSQQVASASPAGGATRRKIKPAYKTLKLKKGYASLKHSLILDELIQSPLAAPSASPTDLASPPMLTANAAQAAAGIPRPISPQSPLPPPAVSPQHSRHPSSTDYSFTYSKSHSSLLERARKILTWCEDAESMESSSAATAPTITFAEIETSIHYLARSFTVSEQATLTEMFQLHGVTALPVQLFREVIRACLDKEEAQKAALLTKSPSSRTPAAAASTANGLSVILSPISSPSPGSALAAAREFNPDAFVTSFIDVLQRKIEVCDVRQLHAASTASNPHVLSSTSHTGSQPLSEDEAVLLTIRTQLRQSEAERAHQKSRYDFNLIFTKRLEAENWQLRETIESLRTEKARADEANDELKHALEAHRALVASLESAHASAAAAADQQREEYENLRVMIELERKSRSKLQFECEKLQAALANASLARSGSNKIYFREGIEEMRKALGNLRYQRQMQLEQARIGVVEAEKAEVVQQLRTAEATIAEQQRILNELQGQNLAKFGARGSIIGIGSELRGPAQPAQPASGDDAQSAAHPPETLRESLSDDMDDDDDDSHARSPDRSAELSQRLATSESALLQAQRAVQEKQAEMSAMRTANETRISQLQSDLAALTASIAVATAQHQAELVALGQEAHDASQRIDASHRDEMAKLRDEHEKSTSDATSQHASALDLERTKATERTEAQLAALRQAHSVALVEADAAHAETKRALQACIDELQSQLKAAQSAAAESAAKHLADQAESIRAQAAAQAATDAIQRELHTTRASLQAAQAALAASESSQRDHVCQVPSSASEAMTAAQESLKREQNRRHELEKQIAASQATLAEKEEQLTTLQRRLEEEVRSWTTKFDAESDSSRTVQAALVASQQQCAELESTNATLRTSLESLQSQQRHAKSELEELTLRLSAAASEVEASQRDAQVQTHRLNSIIDMWKSEAEKGRASLDAAKKDHATAIESVEARLRELERQKQELEEQIKCHVCVTAGAAIATPNTATVHTPLVSPAVATQVPSASPVTEFAAIHAAGHHGRASPAVPLSTPASASVPVASTSRAAPPTLPYTSQQLLELHAYGTFITRTLSDDPDLRHIFPLDLAPRESLVAPADTGVPQSGYGADLLRKLKDGLLLAKLINFVAPRTIDERVLNKRVGHSLGWKAIVENLNVCITSAKALGLTMRVPQDQPAAGEIDAHTGAVVMPDGRRLSFGEEEVALAAVSSPSSASTNYVGIELGSSQLVLMDAESSLENADILLDFLFQIIKTRLVSSLFGPEKRKIERLAGMLQMPKIDAELRRRMMERTKSLQNTYDGPIAAPPTPTTTGFASPTTAKMRMAARKQMTLSKYATLSKALPANLSSSEHRRFVAHFSTTILCDFDSTADLSSLTPEQMLLRWVNFTIMKQSAQGGRAESHFVAHLSDIDLHTYTAIVSQVDRWRVTKGAATEEDARFNVDHASAASLLQYLDAALGVRHFHAPDSIASSHHRLNLLLTAIFFQKWPMIDSVHSPSPVSATAASSSMGVGRSRSRSTARLSFSLESADAMSSASSTLVASASVAAIPSLDGLTEEERESALLTSFLNSSGIPHISVHHLFTDIRSGLILLRFIDYLERACVDWKLVELTPSNKFKCISNLNYALTLARERLRLPFVNVGAVDLHSDANAKFVLAVMWQLMRYHTIQKLTEIRTRISGEGDGGPKAGVAASSAGITDADIIEWANAKVASRVHPMAQANGSTHVASFQDHALRNSLFLLNLLDNLTEDCVDWSQVELPTATTSPTDAAAILLRNASFTISVARKLGAELFALPQDIANSNKKVMMLLIASLMALEGNEPN